MLRISRTRRPRGDDVSSVLFGSERFYELTLNKKTSKWFSEVNLLVSVRTFLSFWQPRWNNSLMVKRETWANRRANLATLNYCCVATSQTAFDFVSNQIPRSKFRIADDIGRFVTCNLHQRRCHKARGGHQTVLPSSKSVSYRRWATPNKKQFGLPSDMQQNEKTTILLYRFWVQ